MIFTEDEKAALDAAEGYIKAIKEYGLDNIFHDGHGQKTKRYMVDGFYSGFYAGRNYQRKKEDI